MEIVLLKQVDARLEEPAATHVRQFLFEHLDGATDQDKRAWRRFVRALHEAGSGEYFTITIKRQRSSAFHRLSMAVMTAVFKAQERFDNFDVFRAFVKIGAGFVDLIPDPAGGVRAVPKSQSFSECSEDDMREFHQNAVAFLRTEQALTVLWPENSLKFSAQGIEQILRSFEK
jgi:hypothetical protein